MVSEILVARYTRVVGECSAAGGAKASRIGRSRPSHQVSASSSTNGHRQDDRRVYHGSSYNAYIGLSPARTGPYPSTAASRWDKVSGAADGSAGLRNLGRLAPRQREIIVKGRPAEPHAFGDVGYWDGALAIEVQKILGHRFMHLQDEAAMDSLAVELLGEALKFYAVLAKLIDHAHHFHQGRPRRSSFQTTRKSSGMSGRANL